jgi:hypothetical protein
MHLRVAAAAIALAQAGAAPLKNVEEYVTQGGRGASWAPLACKWDLMEVTYLWPLGLV